VYTEAFIHDRTEEPALDGFLIFVHVEEGESARYGLKVLDQEKERHWSFGRGWNGCVARAREEAWTSTGRIDTSSILGI